MFNKSNGAKVRSLIERLSDIQETYQILLDGIDEHMAKWKELE